MRFTDAIRWGLYDRLLATVSLLLGLGLAVGGLWIGTNEWFTSALSGNPGATPGGVEAAIALGGVLLGLFVWQIGSTAARHRTMVTATRRELDGVDVEGGDAAAEDGDRLAQLESDVEEVRRVAARIEKSMRDGEFDAEELADGGATAGSSNGDVGAGSSNAATADSSNAASAAGAGGSGTATATGATADAAADTETTADAADAQPSPAQELAAPEIEFSDDPDESQSTGATDEAATTADATTPADDETVGDGGTVQDDGDATAGTDADVERSDATTDDGFEWPEEEDDEYYRNS